MKINIILVLTILICSYLNAETTTYINSKISKENIIDYAMDENNDSGFVLNLGEDVKVSSELKKNKKINYVGKNLADFNLNTAWIEGKNDYGIGENIEFDFKRFSLIGLKKIYIYNGYCKNKKVWEENSRIKKMNIYINNNFYGILELEDTINEQYFDISCKSEIQRIKFEIIEVYSGKKYKDTAISEIFFEENVRCFPAATKITLSDNSIKTIDKLKSGDEVLTYNSDDKKFVKTKVLSVAKVEHDNLIEIDFGDKIITSTDDHPYLSDKGWVSCKPNGTKYYRGYENIKEMKTGDKIYFIGENGKAKFKEIKGIKRVEKKELCYTITQLENGDNFIADGAVVGVEERRYNNKINNTKFKYSDNEILDFAISKGELAKNTVKLKDEPVVGEDMLEKPIFFVYIEGRPNDKKEELYDGELSTKEYYRIYFGQNYGEHVARYQTLFLKYDLSEAYSSEDIIFDKKDRIIYKKSR